MSSNPFLLVGMLAYLSSGCLGKKMKEVRDAVEWKTMDSVFQYVIAQPGNEKFSTGDTAKITVIAVLANNGTTPIDANNIDKECLRFTRIAAQTMLYYNEKGIVKKGEEGLLRGDFSSMDWTRDFSVMFFIEKRTSQSDIDTLLKMIRRYPEVHRAQLISKEEARKRWIESGQDDPLKELDENPLPAHIEVSIEPDYLKEPDIKALAEKVQQQYGDKIFHTYYHAKMIRAIECSRSYIFLISYKT